jgi:hypothetical protein
VLQPLAWWSAGETNQQATDLLCCLSIPEPATLPYGAGLGEMTGVVPGFASAFGVGDGPLAGLVSGDALGEGLPSVVGDFFGVACAVRWRTCVGVAPASRILLPVLSKVLPTVLSVALAPREIALPVA